MVQLSAYLDRIGYRGPLAPTLACLTGIHRCQALSVPYENLDVQLGVPVGQDIEERQEHFNHSSSVYTIVLRALNLGLRFTNLEYIGHKQSLTKIA